MPKENYKITKSERVARIEYLAAQLINEIGELDYFMTNCRIKRFNKLEYENDNERTLPTIFIYNYDSEECETNLTLEEIANGQLKKELVGYK